MNLNIRFKTNNKLSSFIKNNKSKNSKDKKSGVYKLECGTCDKVYISQTGRSFRERLQDLFRSYFNQVDASNYANHLIEANHPFNNNYEVLHQEQKGAKFNALKALEINKLRNDNV